MLHGTAGFVTDSTGYGQVEVPVDPTSGTGYRLESVDLGFDTPVTLEAGVYDLRVLCLP